MSRVATSTRQTGGFSIEVSPDLDGTGQTDIETAVPFFNHMMTALGKHFLIDLTVRARGGHGHRCTSYRGGHRTVFGQALWQALGDKRGIRGFR
jgi:imidazoleglycerol-phosphate dehydratase